MLHYCTTCGRTILRGRGYGEPVCDFCKKEVYPVPEEYLASKISIKPELKDQFIKEYIESSPDFDPEIQKARLEKKRKDDAQLQIVYDRVDNKPIKSHSNPHGVQCPYCKSSNVKKISAFSKALGVGVFGMLGMSKAMKQYHCNQCGADF